LGGSVPILLQKLHPVLYPTYGKTQDAARTFLVQVFYKFEDISFAEFSARFQVRRTSQDRQLFFCQTVVSILARHFVF